MANNVVEEGKLLHSFDEIWAMHEKLENSAEPSNSDAFQELVLQAIGQTEKAVHMVNELNLFATNEDIEEIATSDLRYMLLPALLGYFTNKNTKLDRFDVIQKSQMYLIDFIRLCTLYGITDAEVPKPYNPADEDSTPSTQQSDRSRSADIEQQGRQRQEKIARFRRRKQLEESLQELRLQATKDHADDEISRKYYLTVIDKFLSDAFDSLDSIEAELAILEHMSKMKDRGLEDKPSTPAKKPTQEKPIMRPFIITKNEVQKAVFGLGYPGIPTVTVDEFYNQRIQDGTFPSSHCTDSRHHQHDMANCHGDHDHGSAEKTGREDDQDEDDEDSVHKARAWDDWKDDHRRGWGNTQNKG